MISKKHHLRSALQSQTGISPSSSLFLFLLFVKERFYALHGTGRKLAHGFAIGTQRLLLFVGQAGGHLYVHGDVLVAPAPSVEFRDALTLQAERGAGLGALGQFVFYFTVNGGNFQLCAEPFC